MAKSPKPKEKPTDPLAHVHVHVREAAPRMPALSAPQPAEPLKGHNSAIAEAEEMMTSAVNRLDALDAQIRALNAQKSDVYAEMKARGFDLKAFRDAQKEAKVDPLVLAERERTREIYRDVIRRGLDAAAAKVAKAAEKAA